MLAYFNGGIFPENEIRISPDDRGFLFADGIYEVIRSYSGRLFKAREHIERLQYGAENLGFNTTDFEYLIDVSNKLIKKNELTKGDALVYIQVTRGAALRTHYFPPKDTSLTVFAKAWAFDRHAEELQIGANIILIPDQRWARCDIKSTGLLMNAMGQQLAKERGASEAVFMRDGFITEGTHTNFFAVSGGTVITPPNTNYILEGITRKAVIDLCVHYKISYIERAISQSEIVRMDELFISGTTVEITPVVQINGVPIKNGRPGPITRRLQEAFAKIRFQ